MCVPYSHIVNILFLAHQYTCLCTLLFSEIFQGLDIESEMEKINRPRHQAARKQMGWDNEEEELSFHNTLCHFTMFYMMVMPHPL